MVPYIIFQRTVYKVYYNSIIICTCHPASNTMDEDNNSVCCTVCSEVINDANASSVQCMKCKNWSHTKCSMSKEVFDLLAKVKNDKGKRKPLITSGVLLYVCEPCGASIQETSNTSPIQSTPSLTSTSTQVTQTKTATSTDQNHIHNIPPSTQRPRINEEEISSNQQIENSTKLVCHHYKQGRCWHGKCRLKIYNGRKCINLHPQKCLTYCRFVYGFLFLVIEIFRNISVHKRDVLARLINCKLWITVFKILPAECGL